jgi:3-hydroxyisobutyrate dehydrogenase-like beta-hydroxyacid dehydrogenase
VKRRAELVVIALLLAAAVCAVGFVFVYATQSLPHQVQFEGLALGLALRLDKPAVLDALENSYLGAMVKMKRQKIDAGEYPAQFKLSLATKDLRLAEEAARDAGRTLAVVSTARETFEDAEAAGFGDDDFSAVVEHLIRA